MKVREITHLNLKYQILEAFKKRSSQSQSTVRISGNSEKRQFGVNLECLAKPTQIDGDMPKHEIRDIFTSQGERCLLHWDDFNIIPDYYTKLEEGQYVLIKNNKIYHLAQIKSVVSAETEYLTRPDITVDTEKLFSNLEIKCIEDITLTESEFNWDSNFKEIVNHDDLPQLIILQKNISSNLLNDKKNLNDLNDDLSVISQKIKEQLIIYNNLREILLVETFRQYLTYTSSNFKEGGKIQDIEIINVLKTHPQLIANGNIIYYRSKRKW